MAEQNQPLLSLEQAWRRLMTVLSFTNPVRARQGDRAIRAVRDLQRRR